MCSITVLCMCNARAGAEDSLAEVWDDPACVLNHSVVYVCRTCCVPVLLFVVRDDPACAQSQCCACGVARAMSLYSCLRCWTTVCVFNHSVVYVYRTCCVPVLLLEVLDDFARGLGCVWVVQTVKSSLLLADVRYTVVRAGY